MNIVNNDLSFVVFDGTSNYVVDRQEMTDLTKSDENTTVVFSNYCLDICQDKADELNESI